MIRTSKLATWFCGQQGWFTSVAVLTGYQYTVDSHIFQKIHTVVELLNCIFVDYNVQAILNYDNVSI